jgi:hypothetical protein
MAKSKAGGGINSRNVTRQTPKAGQPAREMRPKGVSQIGQSMGNHVMRGDIKSPRSVEPVRRAARPAAGGPGGVSLGNELAAGVQRGPGGGRTVHSSGSQGQHGAGAGSPKAPAREILGPAPQAGRR